MFSQGSSTSASGHIGTGVGTHNTQWPHYNKPAKGNTRDTHTYYDFDTADYEIKKHANTNGGIFMDVIKFKKVKAWKCSNCNKSVYDRSETGRNGCSTKAGDHKWNEVSTWDEGKKSKDWLYFDKAGAQIQVSYHKI